MLRTERASDTAPLDLGSMSTPRELLLAMAPPPRTAVPVVEGWPSWLIPTFRSGGHRPNSRLLTEDE